MQIAFVNLNPYVPVVNPALVHILTILKQEGYNVSLIDPTVNKNPLKYIQKEVSRIKPSVLCYSCTHYNFEYALNVIKSIKKEFPSIKHLVGGTHPTYHPEKVISCPEVDALFRGEPEFEIGKYLKNINNELELRNVKGLWFKNTKGRVYKNKEVPLVYNLDDLPIADYSFWDIIREDLKRKYAQAR